MANPTAKAMQRDVSKTSDQAGACREEWWRFPGLRASSDQDAGGVDIIYYFENPKAEDMVIKEAFAVVETASGNVATDLDIGLGDDATGANKGAEIADGLVAATLNATGVKRLMAPLVLATPPNAPILKAKGTATDSFLIVTQNGDVDASALRWTFLVKVIPYNDLLNGNVDVGAIAVA